MAKYLKMIYPSGHTGLAICKRQESEFLLAQKWEKNESAEWEKFFENKLRSFAEDEKSFGRFNLLS